MLALVSRLSENSYKCRHLTTNLFVEAFKELSVLGLTGSLRPLRKKTTLQTGYYFFNESLATKVTVVCLISQCI